MARRNGYLIRPDRREHDRAWLAYCRAEQLPYVVLTRTPKYGYLMIDARPLATPPDPAIWERLTGAGYAAVRQSPSMQARVRTATGIIWLEGIQTEDAQVVAERAARVLRSPQALPQQQPARAAIPAGIIDLAAERAKLRGSTPTCPMRVHEDRRLEVDSR
jgi:hypothetical protein